MPWIRAHGARRWQPNSSQAAQPMTCRQLRAGQCSGTREGESAEAALWAGLSILLLNAVFGFEGRRITPLRLVQALAEPAAATSCCRSGSSAAARSTPPTSSCCGPGSTSARGREAASPAGRRSRSGSPSNPSFTSGHAFSAGACVTILKAWVREEVPFPDPVQPTPDGLGLVPYVPGIDGPELTLGGELNKLGHNITWGRSMGGVHWRTDNVEGLRQGEEVALRLLEEEMAIYPEPFSGFGLTKFDGETVTLSATRSRTL
jgi:hypothetical protein